MTAYTLGTIRFAVVPVKSGYSLETIPDIGLTFPVYRTQGAATSYLNRLAAALPDLIKPIPAAEPAATLRLQNQGEVDIKYSGENSGGYVTNNVETRHIQIRFTVPPTKEIQDALRQLGFRWIKSRDVWGRRNTKQAFMTIRHPDILIDLDPHLAWALELLADTVLKMW